MKRWKFFTNACLTVIMAAALSGCGSNASPQNGRSAPNAGPAPDQSASDITELTIGLDWYPNAVHSFLLAAEQQGYFREEHLNVHLQMPSDANDPLKLAAANQLDLAISYQPQIIQARSEGLPVVSIAALVQHPLNAVMVRSESGIESPKDLAGKSIGFPSMPLDESIVRNMVKTDGGDDSGLTFTDVGFDLIPALTGKQVDAIVGGYINHEQLLLEKNGVSLKVFKPTDFGIPDYYELVLATSDETLNKKQPALAAFLRAARKGQAYVNAHPEEALNLLLSKQAQEFPLDEQVEKQSLHILLPLMQSADASFGSQTEANWQTLSDWMYAEKLIGQPVQADAVMKQID
ncbi:ABC transporter substrate-binding protein [Brevibacillus fulvus]|uniref:Hydroxymethylpyrimidine transport system substrate-binding protein n=1 Tax=Brevibacillus fulvus TaxID=1125967 RepID=A0A938XVU5_9BACL|nr:ABC transporter substrate-binding protein [Brevibacillus fulvus]MBM7589044.1 putative hydroxymethylpyrimidine transport system substrate-binding protein [Brevibacillus fulvus]